jgi:hypothetical protein
VTKRKAPAQSLDDRLRAAVQTLLVKISRDPHEHPDVRQQARERLLAPPVEDSIAYVKSLHDPDALRLISDVLHGRARYEAISYCTPAPLNDSPDVRPGEPAGDLPEPAEIESAPAVEPARPTTISERQSHNERRSVSTSARLPDRDPHDDVRRALDYSDPTPGPRTRWR